MGAVKGKINLAEAYGYPYSRSVGVVLLGGIANVELTVKQAKAFRKELDKAIKSAEKGMG